MRLVVGLGNPGERYRRTRHNVGFMVVDALAARLEAARWREQAEALTAEAAVGAEPVLLAKPTTFMNRSGVAVQRLLAERALASHDLLVVVDDFALELGMLRVRARGSHGGHNGLRSLIDVLGTDEFARIRVGIRGGEPGLDLAEYVLSPFPPEEVLIVQELVGAASDATLCLLREGAEAAMNRFNARRA